MAEYKGKLLKGLFTKAKTVLFDNGANVEESIDGTGYTIDFNTALVTGTYQQVVRVSNKLIVNVVCVAAANSSSNQAIFSIKKGTAAISCPTGFVIGYRLTNDGNHAYCPLTASGVVSAGPSYPLVATKIYNFSFIIELS